jgi:hypothetical protein
VGCGNRGDVDGFRGFRLLVIEFDLSESEGGGEEGGCEDGFGEFEEF